MTSSDRLSGDHLDQSAPDADLNHESIPAVLPSKSDLHSSDDAAYSERLRIEFERRDKILAGVNLACTQLIRSKKWQTDIVDVLRVLGEASNSERVGVIRIYKNQENRLTGSVLYVWDAHGIDLLSQPRFHNFDIEQLGFMPLIERFHAGKVDFFHRSQRNEEHILAKDTQTSLNIPIFNRGVLWGTLHFSMTSAERQWTAPEIDALQISADMLSAIIERQQVDEARIQSEERLAQAVRLAQIGVWEWDAVTDDVIWNDEMFRIYGISRDQFTGKGKDVIAFTREDYRAEQLKTIHDAYSQGITARDLSQTTPIDQDPKEFVIVGADGQERSVIAEAISIIDDKGMPVRMLGITVDVTKRKIAETALIERERLEAALQKELEINSIKTRLMRMMAHEFRTPLAIILSTTGILQSYYDRMSSDQRLSRLDTIETQVKRLDGLIREAASVVYELNEPQRLSLRECSLEMLCTTNITEIQNTLGVNHRLSFTTDGQLTRAYVDERLIHRILINLLSNAVKYSPKNTEIQLRLRREGDLAIIEVEDQGIGMSEEDQKHLYEPFYRGQSVRNIEGTGLGLPIVRESVLQHRGTIAVRSEIGKGTCFTIQFPVIEDAFA